MYKQQRFLAWIAVAGVALSVATLPACGGGGSGGVSSSALVVDTLLDDDTAPAGATTLRTALAQAPSGQAIRFDPALDGGTIELTIVGEAHSILKGEVMGIRDEPSGPVSYLVGYFERDYGRSALYARKSVVIDASSLASGITIAWTGGTLDPARVLAVYGDLTLRNVSITGGVNIAEDISTGNPDDQPWTLARGGGVAVWGRARLSDCRIYDNHVQGDFDPSRDRGAFGGGVYADIVTMERCVVSGNSVLGGGAAGGGVFSVGGRDVASDTSLIETSAVTGNRISGLFTYGGGIYSDGGGIGKRNLLHVRNTTVAQNLVEPAPGLPPFVLATGYWRGGGVYVSNGYLALEAVTVVENEVYGVARTDDLGKRNLAGGVAATIGNAHGIEDIFIGHSIIAGNTVHEIGGTSYAHDVFTGSAFYFRSLGYNRIGVIDFSQMLVPVGEPTWASLSRRHYPQVGDMDGVELDAVVERPSGIVRSDVIRSVGVDAPDYAVLHYRPWDLALNQVPTGSYGLDEIVGEYAVAPGAVDNFLAIMLARIETRFGLPGFASQFRSEFENLLGAVDIDPAAPGLQPYLDPAGQPILTLADTHWFGPAVTWPRELYNYPYIEFWHRLDAALLEAQVPGMGPETLGDAAWDALFSSGPLAENPGITLLLARQQRLFAELAAIDQRGVPRPAGVRGDIGAIEVP
ncbi:hypothetical protein [Thioalkalivibrio sp. XN279]|uniref:hypothetical protein n=1 Tax=Thioalkalivibrio sp. XN279 TaxID=2714953 RepID=UPI0014089295|nr:hypothetical protein [Thioalkalivibrio sp. XN279]NHA14660.1 hypothetical protein [Thioalkalivibrio sp. XN279]